ncbi:penicillin-binding protein 1C [Aquimonas voraii]|uniref:peptidoglycan glycosyltransferase n=1 Tax=Aquimonas voraii TaxID=265719 RepID=A0A1G6V3E2_9GAMM|nr:penicillin-binding protein 1C [Aquimonas voraii]SDD47455.1 penicillin-binding protein 1C [Aquimonas voraii]
MSTAPARAQQPPPRPARWPRLRRLAWATLALLLLALLLDRLFPPPLPDLGNDLATVVTARDGRPLRAFPDREGVWRLPVLVDAVSPLYLEALLTYEDRWFWRHPGVNPLAALRALAQGLRHGRVVSGASTLTMQVARLIEPQSPGLLGKLRQSLRALQLEWRLDKREILALYLNYAPFGGPIEGVQAASWAYLGKPANQLSHAEAALLAVLPQSPSRLRPDRHPQRAREARDKVLQRLADFAVWSAATVADARAENVVARSLAVPQSAALLAARLRGQHPGQQRIDSSIDHDLQLRLEAQLGAWIERLPPRTSAAVLVLDNRTAEVRAYLGSARFADDARYGHLDMVQAWRSPGSTLKPFVYGLAIDAGSVHSASLLIDAPQDFDGYRPDNFDQRFRGPVSLGEALQQSLNVPAVAVLQQLGPARFAARLEHAGLPLRLPSGDRPNLSLVLGGTEVRLQDLVAAYAALHREGRAPLPRFRPADPLEERRLLSPGAAWIIAELLRSAPDGNDGRFAQLSGARLAHKTGTSYGFRDSWAVGGNAGVTIGVWVGRPDGTPSPGQFGAITALPVLQAVQASLPGEYQQPAQAHPDSVGEAAICWPLGAHADATQAEHCHRRLDAWLLEGAAPLTLAPAGEAQPPSVQRFLMDGAVQRVGACRRGTEVEEARALWPRLAAPWLSGDERRRGLPPALAADCAGARAALADLQITGAREGSRIRAPRGSAAAPTLSLKAAGASGEVRWLVNGRLFATVPAEQSFKHAFEKPGVQDIVAIDDSARYGRLQIEVLAAE